jgi:hypothetical protein
VLLIYYAIELPETLDLLLVPIIVELSDAVFVDAVDAIIPLALVYRPDEAVDVFQRVDVYDGVVIVSSVDEIVDDGPPLVGISGANSANMALNRSRLAGVKKSRFLTTALTKIPTASAKSSG